ncbi:(2Fe-2S)-binding protein [Pararhizobium sp. LjRoot235]|uniref:(2Fe-2S)-binding protein n=1 Tax=Pararhizobium sp. LjRoot235 TaxID=3342291 RepID=UPI003ECE395E
MKKFSALRIRAGRMLVCSCNFITDKDIEDTIIELLDEDCWQLIVPAKVYHAMQKRGRCCGCFPNVVDIIIRTTERYHASRPSTDGQLFDFMTRLKQFHEENRRADLERRHKSHRAA